MLQGADDRGREALEPGSQRPTHARENIACTSKSTALASAAALLFVAGAACADSTRARRPARSSARASTRARARAAATRRTNECAGHNSCKGKGFMMMTPEECDQAKAKMKDEKEDEG